MTDSKSRRGRAAISAINAQISVHRNEALSADSLAVFAGSDALDYLGDLLTRGEGGGDLYLEIAARFLAIGVQAGAAVEASELLNNLSDAPST